MPLPPPPALPPLRDHPRLGYCCKWLSPEGDAEAERRMNCQGTTVSALSRLDPAARTAKLLALVEHNLAAARRQVEEVAARPPLQRLHRLLSDLLPAATHPLIAPHYAEPALRGAVEAGLAAVGAAALAGDVRLSTHPGQFTVLSTANPTALDNAVKDLEHHALMFAMMGLAGGWHPRGAHVNVHGGARAPGVEGFRAGLARLSPEARGLVTVENDEVSYGLDDLLPLAGEVAIVVDVHHHWIASRGEWIEPEDPRMERARASWRGARPIMHVSHPREAMAPGLDPAVPPSFAALTAIGISAKDLRAHGDRLWSAPANRLVGRHLAHADFEVEAKAKNLASEALAAELIAAGAPAALAAPLAA